MQSCTSLDNPFTPVEICKTIKALKSGKACGRDGLQSEHFRYCSDKIHVLLSLLFNAMITHGYVCDGIMDTVLIPIVKDKKGDLSSKDNYRPIAITSVLSKVLESVILSRFQYILVTHHNQFGFKNDHSTDMCIFSLKHVIDYYNHMSSPIYLCYLDASKAFDRLNFWVLFRKLLDRNLPSIIVRLLVFWYCKQKFVVRWGSTTSEAFGASNGVRQGGVLSPYLFNVYMDGLSALLNKSDIGCKINNVSYNHFMYADDTALVSPSPRGLQNLIHICETYADMCDIIFNVSKSKYMCIKPKQLKNLHVPMVHLNGSCLDLVHKYKYLGHIMCNDNKDEEAISSQIRAIYSRGNAIIKHFKYCSEDTKSLLFKTFCSTFYCCHLWSNCSVLSRERIKVAHNRIFRILMKLDHRVSMSYVFLKHKISHSNVIFRTAMNGFIRRIYISDNALIATIVNSNYFTYSTMMQFWCNSLEVMKL